MIRDLLWRLFRSPSAYERDWRAFALNQAGHALVIGALPVLLLGPLVMAALVPAYLFWEAAQFYRHEAEAWDCAEDAGFVLLGALAAIWWPVMSAVLVFLAAGAFRRISLED